MNAETHMRVFLTGATGFVGSHLLSRLLREHHQVRALVRKKSTRLPNFGETSQVEQVEGDITAANLADSLAGCDAVINLVGIIAERGRETFQAIHYEGTRSLVKAARSVGVTRFVQMSALGARPGDASPYHTTKFAAEEEVRGSGIPWVVLRPSLIFGPGSAFVQQMADVMRAAPLIRPVPGTGEYRFRPIHVDDVAECFTQALSNSAATGQTINLVGGEELTLNQIAGEIAACLGIHKKVVHVPIPLMKMAAAVFSVLPITPPVTSVQIRMLEEGSTADPEPMRRIFGIEPIAFRAGLRKYLPD
jgi:NADH dehydrogenase